MLILTHEPGTGAPRLLRLLIRIVELGVPEGRACRVLGQHRSTQRKPPSAPDDEAALTGLPLVKWSIPCFGFGRGGGPSDAVQEEAHP
jgi:hypothetical protein